VQSHENEKKLVRKVKELNNEIVANGAEEQRFIACAPAC